MEISRRADYAIRLIAALAEAGDKPLSVRAIAEKQSVPYAFARSIQHDLVRAGLIATFRGAQGGMRLVADPAKLTLFELVETVQGPLSVAVCTHDEDWCARRAGCPFHGVWQGANSLLKNYLTSVSIQELIDGKHAFLSADCGVGVVGDSAHPQ